MGVGSSNMTQFTRNGAGTRGRIEHLTESEHHELFTAERRRTTLDILGESTGSMKLEDLAATVAERENGGDVVEDGAVERVAGTLHHVHLPKMDDLGVIDYDPDTSRVELCL